MKTNLDKMFKNDVTQETEGIWFDISDEVGFKVKRFGGENANASEAAMTKHFKPYARAIQFETMDPKKESELMTKVFVEACMVDWKGVEIDGEIVKYTPEKAIQLFLARPELRKTLVDYASQSKNYREDLGNS